MSGVSFFDRKFLIIGGTSKGGTTSAFNYLCGHQRICAAFCKETRFFLDADYPLTSKKRCYKDGAEAYKAYFDVQNDGDDKWMLDATPDYLHSPGTARLVRQTLPRARFVFILREPVSRLLSWYKFGQSINEVPVKMTFDEYVQAQVGGPGGVVGPGRHPAFLALEQGCYSNYLKRYLDQFEREAVDVRFYEDLKRDPAGFARELCGVLEIDPAGLSGEGFGAVNQGVQVRNPRLHRAYFETKDKLRGLVRNITWVRRILRSVGRRVDGAYKSMNVTKGEKPVMSSGTEEFLRQYYSQESSRLQQLLGQTPPWLREKRTSQSVGGALKEQRC